MSDEYQTEDKPITMNKNEDTSIHTDNEPNFVPSEAPGESEALSQNDQAKDSDMNAQKSAPSDMESDVDKSGKTAAEEERRDNLQERIEALEAEVAEMSDRALRALAEAENVRRRAQRDKEDASKYAIKNFAEDMIRVSDNLGRALSSIDDNVRGKDINLDNMAVGVEMVQKELLAAFERAKVKPILALGARFDPMKHEAMFEIEDPNQPAGTVSQVLEDGFTLHDRTLRAAKVGVTKGGPKSDFKSSESLGNLTSADLHQREGQQAYEQKPDGSAEAGEKLDEEL